MLLPKVRRQGLNGWFILSLGDCRDERGTVWSREATTEEGRAGSIRYPTAVIHAPPSSTRTHSSSWLCQWRWLDQAPASMTVKFTPKWVSPA